MANKENKKTVIALGYFDSVHIGHRIVISKAKDIAKDRKENLSVFSFKGNLKKAVGCNGEKYVYSYTEREVLFKEAGVDNVFFADCNSEFLSKSGAEFLDYLNENLDISTYVCGSDYKFGSFKSGNVDFLTEYAKAHNQTVEVVSTCLVEGKKVATSEIKELLSKGEIEKANEYLYTPYSITATVFLDRRVGSKIGFPTLNVKIDSEKQELKNGVYAGHIFLQGKRYKTVNNYGARPTFSLNEKLVETHVINYTGNLYGKEVRIYFDSYIRDIKKFESVEDLVNQIEKDCNYVKGLK